MASLCCVYKVWCVPYTKSSIPFISQIYAIFACFVNVLHFQSKRNRTGNRLQSDITAEEHIDFSSFYSLADNECKQRGGRKMLVTIRLFKRYMSAAVSQLLDLFSNDNLYECDSRRIDQNDLRIVSIDLKMTGTSKILWNFFQKSSCHLELAILISR